MMDDPAAGLPDPASTAAPCTAASEVVTWTGATGPRRTTLRRGRRGRPPGWPTRCATTSASPATSGSPRSCGTTPSTWSPTSRCRAWARCCTRSTSGCSPTSSPTSPTTPRTGSSSSTTTLIPLLAKVLPQLTTVEHVVVVGDGDAAPLGAGDGVTRAPLGRAARRQARPVTTGRTSTRTTPPRCATPPAPPATRRASPTPTARSTCTRCRCAWPRRSGSARPTGSSSIVPMFHAMAWGLPYAAFMSGASLLMPDRFLQADADRRDDRGRAARPRPARCRRSGPTCCAYLDANPTDTSSLQGGHRRRLGLPAGADARVRGAARHRDHPRLGHDRDVAARLGGPRRRPALTGDEAWAYRYTQGRVPAGVEARIVGPTGERDARRRQGRRRAGGPRAVGHRRLRRRRRARTRRSSATAGCAPATSARCRADGFLTLTDRAKDVIKSGGEWISLGRAGERADGPPGGAGGVRGRRARRAVGRASAGDGRAARGRHGDRRRAARVPRPSKVAALAAAGALGVHRGGAEDQRRQVRQEAASAPSTPTARSRWSQLDG